MYNQRKVVNRRKRVSDLKTERITVQVSIREKEIIEARADKSGLNVSDYIRIHCIHKPYDELFSSGGDY